MDAAMRLFQHAETRNVAIALIGLHIFTEADDHFHIFDDL